MIQNLASKTPDEPNFIPNDPLLAPMTPHEPNLRPMTPRWAKFYSWWPLINDPFWSKLFLSPNSFIQLLHHKFSFHLVYFDRQQSCCWWLFINLSTPMAGLLDCLLAFGVSLGAFNDPKATHRSILGTQTNRLNRRKTTHFWCVISLQPLGVERQVSLFRKKDIGLEHNPNQEKLFDQLPPTCPLYPIPHFSTYRAANETQQFHLL